MASWGFRSYENDQTMDLVGEIWNEVFKGISRDMIGRVLDPIYEKQRNSPLAFLLWTFCSVELPDPLLRRIACLLTTYKPVATAFISEIGVSVFEKAIEGKTKNPYLASAISFFVNELETRMDPKITLKALKIIEQMLSKSLKEEERGILDQELTELKKNV